MSGKVVIVAYRPKPGKNDELATLMNSHWARLKSAGLVTDRLPVVMTSADGTYLEVFEWRSREAVEQAHTAPAIMAMWDDFGAVCEYVPASEVREMSNLFSEFSPVDVALS